MGVFKKSDLKIALGAYKEAWEIADQAEKAIEKSRGKRDELEATIECKRRRENPSVKRPDRPVAPE